MNDLHFLWIRWGSDSMHTFLWIICSDESLRCFMNLISSLEMLHGMHQNFLHLQFHFFNRNWVGLCVSWVTIKRIAWVVPQPSAVKVSFQPAVQCVIEVTEIQRDITPKRGWKKIPLRRTMRCATTTWRSLARNFSSKSFLLAFFRNKFSFSFFLSCRKWQQRSEREGFTSRTDDDIRSLRSKHVARQGKNRRHKDAQMKQHFKVLEL